MNESDTTLVPPHDPYAALRQPGYRLYLIGWIVALLGTQIESVAVGWQLFDRTGDALVLGWVGLVQALPVILLAIPAGQLSDKVSRRTILMATMAAASLCSIGLALLSWRTGPVWAYYAVLGAGATANAIGWPARAALVPQLVPTEQLANAITWNSTTFQLASIVGPGLGGLIVAYHATAGYALAALGFATFAGLLGFVALRRPATRSREPVSRESLIAGVRFVHRQKAILATITLDLVAVLLGGATYLLPVFAKDILHAGPTEFGWLRAAPSVGALVMAMAMAHLPPAKYAGRAMLWAVAGFGVATVVFGLSHNLWLSLAMLFLTGMFDNISVVVRHTLVQVLTPDEMRGRVSAVNTVFIGASNELGGFESGLTARLFGPVWSVVGGGLGALLATAWTAWQWPQIRAIGALHEVKPAQESAGLRPTDS
jgi:MFS family permease